MDTTPKQKHYSNIMVAFFMVVLLATRKGETVFVSNMTRISNKNTKKQKKRTEIFRKTGFYQAVEVWSCEVGKIVAQPRENQKHRFTLTPSFLILNLLVTKIREKNQQKRSFLKMCMCQFLSA